MRTVTIQKNVFKFCELSEKAKEKVINDTIAYLMDHPYEVILEIWPDVAKSIEKADKMQTPWFAGSYIYEECFGNTILPIIEEFEYLEDGECFQD
jgi:hypothetical protein